MTSLTGCFRQSPGLRLRPVPELDTCLVYRPRPPRLFRLSLSAWLVLELCDGLDDAQLVDAYRQTAGNRMNGEQAARQARQGLEMLMQNGLVHSTASE